MAAQGLAGKDQDSGYRDNEAERRRDRHDLLQGQQSDEDRKRGDPGEGLIMAQFGNCSSYPRGGFRVCFPSGMQGPLISLAGRPADKKTNPDEILLQLSYGFDQIGFDLFRARVREMISILIEQRPVVINKPNAAVVPGK
jgi:hypothetical protein